MDFPKGCKLPQAIRSSIESDDSPCEDCAIDCPVRLAEIPRCTLLEVHDEIDADLYKDGEVIDIQCSTCKQRFKIDGQDIAGHVFRFIECDCGTTTLCERITVKGSVNDRE